MEKRVQCLERIVREQQHEMERLMGIILPINPPVMHVPGLHQSNLSAAYRAPLENQNFYFHDESVVGLKTPAKQRKTPLQNDQNWYMQSKGSNTSEKKNKDTRAVTKAFPVGKPKPANNLRVPMKQSRAVNAAKDFIDYIANKEVVVAKNVRATDASSAHNYRAGSRLVPHPVLSAASRSNKKGKRITAPTTDKNAKSSFLIPQRDHTARSVIVTASTSRSAFVSNFDRDQCGYGTKFISNADRPNYDQYVRDRDEFVSNPNPDPLSYDGYDNRNGRTGNYGRFSSDFSNISYASNGAYGDQQGQGFYCTGPATVTACSSSSSSSSRARYMGAGAEKASSMHRDDERDSYMSRPQGQRPYMNIPDPEQRTYVSSKFMMNTKEKAKASKVAKKVPKKGDDTRKAAAAAAAVLVPAAVVRRKDPDPVEHSDSDIVVVMTSSERARAHRGLPAADAHEIITLYDSSSSSSNDSSSSSSDSSSSSSSNNRSRRKVNARSGNSATDSIGSITVGSKRKDKEKAPGESEMSKKKSAPLPVPITVSVSGITRTTASTVTHGLLKATSSSSSSSSSSAVPTLPPPPPPSHSAISSKPTTAKTAPTPSPTPTRPTTADRQRVLSPSAVTSNSTKASSASSSSSSSSSSPPPLPALLSTYSTSYPSYSSTRPPSQSTVIVAPPASASAVTASSLSSSSFFPTSTPTSKSSGVTAAAATTVVSTKEEVKTHNKTAQSDNESENDQDRKKIKKVLSLIQTLTSLSDRQQMAEQLLDKYQTKPTKTKTLIDAGKEIFQEWLAEEVMSFSEETNVLLVEMMLKITDKATWSPEDIARLRVDRTIRQCYKACSALFGTTSGSFSACSALINLTKELWPKYRQMYKVYNSNTSALRNPPESDPLSDAKAYWQ